MFVQGIIRLFVKYLYVLLTYFRLIKSKNAEKVPVSVNYHFTRECNYSCGFCFHTAKTSYVAPIEDIKVALRKLMEKGMRKINLSGGEPFLHPELLGQICKFSKEELNLESVSIVTNGSKVRENFFRKYGTYVDIIAVSVDSFDEETNVKIGRGITSRKRLLVVRYQVL